MWEWFLSLFGLEQTPSITMFRQIGETLRTLQQRALKNIRPEAQAGEMRGLDLDAMQNQTLTVAGTIRFVYTVEKHSRGLVHMVSSQLCKPKRRKYQVQCMLTIMLHLSRQLSGAGIKSDDVKFEVTESELGTQYVAMLVSLEQQEKMNLCGTAKPANPSAGLNNGQVQQ
jgi:hypothetical protein